MATLDEGGRNLLEQVSTLGEDVPLSMVTGATNVSEGEVLEFLNRARTLGLLRTDFQNNDETMRFLGEGVREIVYGSIEPERRQGLHEHVAAYQEGLHQQRLGPSASVLAYHFQRAADHEKASRYDHIHDLQAGTFDPDEAAHYTGEHLAKQEEESRDEKLGAGALAQLPNLFRAVVTAVRSVTLYPLDSQPVQKAYQAAFDRRPRRDLALPGRTPRERPQGGRERLPPPRPRLPGTAGSRRSRGHRFSPRSLPE
jgi:hypothetical protein